MTEVRDGALLDIRVARTLHRCDGYPTCGGISPGEVYEDWKLPPGREPNYGTRWWASKVHHPSNGQGGPSGCELAAAYREHARRQALAEVTS